jgi:hypothetical protein
MAAILPGAFDHLHKAHVALCEATVLIANHGRHSAPWPRLTPAKLRAVSACPSGVRIFRNMVGSSVTLTPWMCKLLAPHVLPWFITAYDLLVGTGKPEAKKAARKLETARVAIADAKKAMEAWQTEQNYAATARWPLPAPETVIPPSPDLSPERWKRLLQVAGERYEREHARALARREADYSEVDKEIAPTKEAIAKAEAELGLATMNALGAFLD